MTKGSSPNIHSSGSASIFRSWRHSLQKDSIILCVDALSRSNMNKTSCICYLMPPYWKFWSKYVIFFFRKHNPKSMNKCFATLTGKWDCNMTLVHWTHILYKRFELYHLPVKWRLLELKIDQIYPNIFKNEFTSWLNIPLIGEQ